MNRLTPYCVLLALLATVICAPADASARKIRKHLKTSSKSTVKTKYGTVKRARRVNALQTAHYVSPGGKRMAFIPDSIGFRGYDKPCNSRVETMLILNGSEAPVNGVEFCITYLDMKGRMLHRRNVYCNCDIPAGETRSIEFKSWDKQQTYYYHLSGEPRRSAAPYRVEVEPLSFTLPEEFAID